MPEPSIDVEDKTGLLQGLPVVASTFPDLISSSEPEISMTATQENDFSAATQIDTHATVNSSLVSTTMISVEVAVAQGIVIINGKSDSFIAEDFCLDMWTRSCDLICQSHCAWQ